jgi:hypothetical protein
MMKPFHNQTPLAAAYQVANEILASRDGAGFRFIVTMNGGKAYDVTPLPDDSLVYPEVDVFGNETECAFWKCEHGDNFLVLRHSEIASIEVYEV